LAKADDVVGRHAAEFTTPAAYERLFGDAAAVMKAGHDVARSIEVQICARDGAVIDLEFGIARVPWPAAPQEEAFLCVARDVTRRKADRAELERHRNELEAVVRARTAELERITGSLTAAQRIAHMGSWELDPATNDLLVSDELRLIYGFALEAQRLTLADVDDRIHPDDRTAAVAVRQRALQEPQAGHGYSNQYRIVLPGGETRVVHVIGEIVRDATGQLRQVFGMAQDITERERITTEVNRRVQELSSLQALAHGISFELPFEEIIQTFLERIVAVAGLDQAQVFLLGEGGVLLARARTRMDGLVTPRCDPNKGECLCGIALQDRQIVYSGEVQADVRCSGSDCRAQGMHSVAALPLRSRERLIGVLVVGTMAPDALADRLVFLETVADVIAARLHNALLHQEIREHAAGLLEMVEERTRELQAERDRTHAILETVGESVVVTDQDGQVLFANPATEQLTGLPRDECLGRPLWQGWTEQAVADSVPAVMAALGAGESWHGEVTGLRRGGRHFTVMLTGTPLYDAGTPAVPVGGVWVQRDITAVKEAERLKDLFVSNVSHELRTPVSIISLSCDNLRTFGERLDDRQRGQILHDIHEQAHVLQGLVDNVLLSFQLGGGHLDRPMAAVDLAALVREEAERQQAVARQRAQQLVVSAEMPVVVRGSAVHLRQVVRNLVDNAIKYTPAGGRIECACTVRACEAGAGEDDAREVAAGWAVVVVSDSGRGIDAHHLPRLFDRFYRVDAEGDVPGTGLGLPIARELVELHGGRVEVASAPGRGSTFTVYLPLIEEGRVEG
jgi:PAS domain S-box-containing protein